MRLLRRWGLVIIVLALAIGAPGFHAPRPAAAAPWTALKLYFPETGHHLGGEFLQAWLTRGGLMVFGYPISEPFTQDGLVVHYFERARFEQIGRAHV